MVLIGRLHYGVQGAWQKGDSQSTLSLDHVTYGCFLIINPRTCYGSMLELLDVTSPCGQIPDKYQTHICMTPQERFHWINSTNLSPFKLVLKFKIQQENFSVIRRGAVQSPNTPQCLLHYFIMGYMQHKFFLYFRQAAVLYSATKRVRR